MKIALVGATGMVGGVVLEVIKERKLYFDELYLVASRYWRKYVDYRLLNRLKTNSNLVVVLEIQRG